MLKLISGTIFRCKFNYFFQITSVETDTSKKKEHWVVEKINYLGCIKVLQESMHMSVKMHAI